MDGRPPIGNDLAEALVNRGFNVEQLLYFYEKYASDGKIKGDTTTNQVVSEIVIEETWERTCSYMESDFMEDLGGGQTARRLVSHAWKSRFVNTCLNIILDATEWPREKLFRPLKDEKGKPIEERDENGKKRTVGEFYHKGMLKADRLLRTLERDVLDKTYWLCIWAVDEHHAICGDCWHCNGKTEWLEDPVKHLRANPCLLCGGKKFNPCLCGSRKYKAGDEMYEIDKFPIVVKQMEVVVVSLDPDMDTIRRVWVVAEIGEAIQFTTAYFRLALGLSDAPMTKLSKGEELMETVENCQATSDDDRQRILADIRKMEGGIEAYDLFINCMLELQFGRASRLQLLPQSVKASLTFLRSLYLDFQWNQKMERLTEELMGSADSFVALNSLLIIGLYFRGLEHLMSTEGLGERLCHLKALTKLEIDFTGCSSIPCLASFEKIGELKALASLNLKFIGCNGLTSVDALGKGLAGLQALTLLDLSFDGCSRLVSIDELGNGLASLQALTTLKLHSKECIALRSAAWAGLAGCKALTSLTLIFCGCRQLTSVDELGKGLAGLKALTILEITFEECRSLRSAGLEGLAGCEALKSLTLNFSCCRHLIALDGLGEGLLGLQALVSLDLKFSKCEELASIDELGKGLAGLQVLTSLKLDFSECRNLTSIDGLGKGLTGFEARTTELIADFKPGHAGTSCAIDGRVNSVILGSPAQLAGVEVGMKMIQINDSRFHSTLKVEGDSDGDRKYKDWVDGQEDYQSKPYQIIYAKTTWSEAEGSVHLKALTSLKLDFTGCERLTSIDELGKGLAGLQALQPGMVVAENSPAIRFEEPALKTPVSKALTALDLSFSSCKGLISIGELGKGLENLQALTSINLDFTGCVHLTSIDELGKGLAGLQALSVLALDFSECEKLQSIDGLGKGLAGLQALTSLKMYFFECGSLHSVGLAGLSGCKALASLDLGFYCCQELTSIEELNKGLAGVKALTSLSLGFCYCKRLASIGELLQTLAGLQGLLRSQRRQDARHEGDEEIVACFRVDLRHCDSLPPSLRENFQHRQHLLKEYGDEDENAPKEIAGHLWKKSPSVMLSWKYQQRYFRVKGGRIRWWQTKEDFHKWGKSKGCVDLKVNAIEVVPESKGTRFIIKPKEREIMCESDTFADADEERDTTISGRRWVHGNFTGSKDGREFYLDAASSEHSREDWISLLQEHEAYASSLKEAEEDLNSTSSFPRSTMTFRSFQVRSTRHRSTMHRQTAISSKPKKSTCTAKAPEDRDPLPQNEETRPSAIYAW